MKGTVVALSGGVGGAKLALGLSRVVDPSQLVVVANTGDDFVHLGLAVSPDVDTLVYTLAGLVDPERGWGRRDESWHFMDALERLGGDTWFRLGDADLAMHVERTRRLAAGERLTAVTADFARQLGVAARVLPMSDDPVRTRLQTGEGWMDFQEYFVRRRCEPRVHAVDYAGAGVAAPAPGLLEALRDPGLAAIVICPSNPLLSIGPILAVPGIREAIASRRAPAVAVSPLIGGAAVKGPTAKMMRELGGDATASEVAHGYAGLIDALVADPADAGLAYPPGLRVHSAPALMNSIEDRERLARAALAAAEAAGRNGPG